MGLMKRQIPFTNLMDVCFADVGNATVQKMESIDWQYNGRVVYQDYSKGEQVETIGV
jgi:hypothetical protein